MPQQRFSTPSKASAFLFVQTCLHPGNMHHMKETCLRSPLSALLETRKSGLFLFKSHTGSSPLLVNDELVYFRCFQNRVVNVAERSEKDDSRAA